MNPSIFVPSDGTSYQNRNNNATSEMPQWIKNAITQQSESGSIMRDINGLLNIANNNASTLSQHSMSGGAKRRKSRKASKKSKEETETKPKRRQTKRKLSKRLSRQSSKKGSKQKREIPEFLRFMHEVSQVIKKENPDFTGAPAAINKLSSELLKEVAKDVKKAIELARKLKGSGELKKRFESIAKAIAQKRKDKKKQAGSE